MGWASTGDPAKDGEECLLGQKMCWRLVTGSHGFDVEGGTLQKGRCRQTQTSTVHSRYRGRRPNLAAAAVDGDATGGTCRDAIRQRCQNRRQQ